MTEDWEGARLHKVGYNDDQELRPLTVAEGDINERAIGITFETAIAILREGNQRGGDALALYCFYCITARRQKHGSTIHATTKYCAQGLGWGVARVRRASAWLDELGLVEHIAIRGEGNRIVGHRIKIRFLLAGRSTLAVFHRLESPEAGKLNTIEDKRREKKISTEKKDISGRSRFRVPAIVEVIEYGVELGVSAEDCEQFYNHHQARGWWLARGVKMKDWRAALRTWQRNIPAFKREAKKPVTPISMRNKRINELNQKKVYWMRQPESKKRSMELEQIRIQLFKL